VAKPIGFQAFRKLSRAQARKLKAAQVKAEARRRALAAADTRKRKQRERAERNRLRAERRARTIRAKKNVTNVLRTMLDAKARGAGDDEWDDIRPDWYASKQELYDAVDEDFDRYAEILEDIADDVDTDWAIAYGPESE